jgi:hypothetical protein
MSATVVDTSGLDRLRARFERLVNPDPTPLLASLMLIMDDDNRKGILAETDGAGNPLAPVSYRPVIKGGRKLTIAERLGQHARKRRGRLATFGSIETGLNNNLSSSAYSTLAGPPLAPRGQFSRVITNYVQRFGRVAQNVWEVIGYWYRVISPKEVAFLKFHFNGQGQKIRDLRGIRPEGIARARRASRAWMIDQIRSNNA